MQIGNYIIELREQPGERPAKVARTKEQKSHDRFLVRFYGSCTVAVAAIYAAAVLIGGPA